MFGDNRRKEKICEVVRLAAAEFVQIESNQNSMITVTSVELSKDFKNAVIFVTVFPEETEEKALAFLHRQLRFFRAFIKEKTRLQYIPWFDFQIDGGEKKRQRIEEISKNL